MIISKSCDGCLKGLYCGSEN